MFDVLVWKITPVKTTRAKSERKGLILEESINIDYLIIVIETCFEMLKDCYEVRSADPPISFYY